MKKCLLLLCLALIPLRPATAADPARDILGIRAGMPKAEVKKRLEELGKLERDERKRQEVWKIEHERFSHLVVGFDEKETLRYVTAVAREDKEAKRMAYEEVGDLKKARQAGDPKISNFNYEWSLEKEGDAPAVLVIARGRDPKFLSTYSLKRTVEADESETD